jgi:hypothetical protein
MPLDKNERFRLQGEVNTGAQIQELLNHPIVQEHLNGLLHGYQNMWLDTPPNNNLEREQLYNRAMALKDLLESFQTVINTGLMAAEQLRAARENDDAKPE